jgi:hypothetical protein
VANKTKPRGGPNKDDEQTTTAADPAGATTAFAAFVPSKQSKNNQQGYQ